MADDAVIHARWHRALDNPDAEPEGPILDHIRQALAKAWDAGHDAATDAAPEDVWFGAWSVTRNPYRIEEDQ